MTAILATVAAVIILITLASAVMVQGTHFTIDDTANQPAPEPTPTVDVIVLGFGPRILLGPIPTHDWDAALREELGR